MDFFLLSADHEYNHNIKLVESSAHDEGWAFGSDHLPISLHLDLKKDESGQLTSCKDIGKKKAMLGEREQIGKKEADKYLSEVREHLKEAEQEAIEWKNDEISKAKSKG